MAAHKIEVVKLEPWHAEHVTEFMRDIDRKEIYYMAALQAAPAVRVTVARSLAAWTATVDDEPAIIFGVNRQSAISRVGVPWMLCTDAVIGHGLALAIGSREYFGRMWRAFDRLDNRVLAENVETVRWLKWLGFDMQEPQAFGAFRAPFIRFGKGLPDVR